MTVPSSTAARAWPTSMSHDQPEIVWIYRYFGITAIRRGHAQFNALFLCTWMTSPGEQVAIGDQR